MCKVQAKEKKGFNKVMDKHITPSVYRVTRWFLRFILGSIILITSPILLILAVFQDWIMSKFLNFAYIYNVSWEDPRMDHEVFNLQESDHVITIASAGCNVLDYVIEGSKVTAVDFNACQIALTELKAIAIQNIEFDDFFAIFAKNDCNLLRKLYPTHIRPFMSKLGTDFWDGYVKKITTFQYSGTSGLLAFFAFRVVFPLLWLGWIRKAILEKIPQEEFHRRCDAHKRQISILAWFMDTLLPCFALFAGVPKRQMKLGDGRENFSVIVNHVLYHTDLVYDNYFYLGYILGEYTEECCPRYLKRENYLKMRKYLKSGKLQLFHGSIEQAIVKNAQDNDDLFTVASLLDHMDWMDKAMITSELALLWERMDHSCGRVYWRSFSEKVHIPPLVWLNADKVDDVYINGRRDRLGMYFSTWIAHLKDTPYDVTKRCASWDPQGYKNSVVGDVLTGAKIVTAPVWKKVVNVTQAASSDKNQHEKDMEAFYRFQKEGYDNFREKFLWARKDLIESIPLKTHRDNVWIDVGGGTARNLEFIPVDTIKKYFSQIFIVDVSASLLQVAHRRVKKMGLSNYVTLIEHDFTKKSIFDVIPRLNGQVDVVTFSYSLSMIPDKVAAINTALKFLKPNGEGVVGIGDFFLSGGIHEDQLSPILVPFRKAEALFQRKWFQQDGVHLLDNQIMEKIQKSTEVVWDERFRGSVPLIPMLRPYHGAYVARTKSKSA